MEFLEEVLQVTLIGIIVYFISIKLLNKLNIIKKLKEKNSDGKHNYRVGIISMGTYAAILVAINIVFDSLSLYNSENIRIGIAVGFGLALLYYLIWKEEVEEGV
ncbi:hypothetical protein M4I33_02975 [Clostridium sp. LY3-2]|uniref:hypothetical protein n=1 Tax=Clostridium sp. LY3-2 TaxID=2942482 RepID=UPI00215379BA|nr:hypothetical protein [Clostridium sp. LY3-2]MCR6513844.1 hypothetical protein [Clostridium sp. LY3-2]